MGGKAHIRRRSQMEMAGLSTYKSLSGLFTELLFARERNE